MHAVDHALSAAPAVLSAESIREILGDRIEKHRSGVGLIVALVEAGGQRIVSAGRRAADDDRPLDGDTVFNVTCLVKLFTALLLCDMARGGEVRVTDAVSTHLPPGAPPLARGGTPITLLELATHTSGLPAAIRATPLDRTMCPAFSSVEQMYRSLATYTFPASGAPRYTYSTLGMQLLAHALSLRAGCDYDTLVQSRICGVLGLRSTRATSSADLTARMAAGHNDRLIPVSGPDVVIPGGSQLFSTANDLSAFVRACLGYTRSSLDAPMAAMLGVRRPTYSRELSIALGWHVLARQQHEIVWHHGLGRGYRTFLGARFDTGTAVIVLSNAATHAGVHDIGFHLLDPSYPLLPPDSRLFQAPDRYVRAPVDAAVYSRYAGVYQLTPNRMLRITRDDTRLLAQWTGGRQHEVVPRSERDFFYEVDEPDINPYTTLTFELDANDAVVGLTVHNLSRDLRLVRVAEEPQPVWFGRRQTDATPGAYDGYAGRYEIGSTVVTIAPDGAQLYLDAPGDQRVELLPHAPHRYFYKSDTIDAEVTFDVDADGRATGIVLLSNELSERGLRVDDAAASRRTGVEQTA